MVSCDPGKDVIPGCKASPAGDTASFSYNQSTALFESCITNLHATVTQIMDSRCPADAVCIWAGTVSVVLRIDSQFRITLPLKRQMDTVFNNRKYSFTLVDVTPYPSLSQTMPFPTSKALIRVVAQ